MAGIHTVGWDLDPNPDRPAVQAADTVPDGARAANIGCVSIHSGLIRTHAFIVNPVAGLGPTDLIITQAPEAGGDVVDSWRAIELVYVNDDTEVTIEARLVDGALSSLYWDGGAWVAAGALDWNTPDDVELNFGALTPSDTRLVGVEWRITSTATAELSPRIYGAIVLADIRFSWRSGADGRSDSWTDDMIHNVVLRMLRDLRPEVSDEVRLGSVLVDQDYSAGLHDKSGHVVADVKAVFDLDADPTLTTPLAGTFDFADKIWTAATPIPAGTLTLFRVSLEPGIEFSADDETFIKTLPAYIIENVTGEDDKFSSEDIVVRNRSAGTAEAVTAPSMVVSVMRCRAESDDVTTALAMIEAAKDLFEIGEIVLKSSATGQLFTIEAGFGITATPGTEAVRGTVSFRLRVRTTVWYGLAKSRSLVVSGGFEPTVTVPTGVLAP